MKIAFRLQHDYPRLRSIDASARRLKSTRTEWEGMTMRAMMKSLAPLIAGGVALALSAVPVRAMPVPPVWTYFATSCYGCGAPPPTFTLFYSPSRAIATFSSPDRSGTYSFSQSQLGGAPVIMGNDDFNFSWNGIPPVIAPFHNNLCSFGYGEGCGFFIIWAQSAFGLSIQAGYGDNQNDITVRDTLITEVSDPDFGANYTGYWTTSSVPLPEPSSVAGLASAVLGFFVILLRRGQAEPLRRNPPGDHRSHRNLARKLRV